MAFDYKPHIMKLKGKEYLPVAARIAWLRSEHPGAQIDTELVTLDLDAQLAVFRATVVIPETGARATDYGSETAKDFGDYIEKACTKAIGRAIAALGYGTLMALELDEGERIVDSPVGPAVRGAGSSAPGPPGAPGATADRVRPRQGAERQAPGSRSAADLSQQELAARIRDQTRLPLKALADWAELARGNAAVSVPKKGADMTAAWLLALYQELAARGFTGRIGMARTQDEIPAIWDEVTEAKERREISAAHYAALDAAASARYKALAPASADGPAGGTSHQQPLAEAS